MADEYTAPSTRLHWPAFIAFLLGLFMPVVIFLGFGVFYTIGILAYLNGNLPKLVISVLAIALGIYTGIRSLHTIRRRSDLLGEGRAKAGIVLSILWILPVFIAFWYSQVDQLKSNRQSKCILMQRQLSTAVMMYAHDHDDHLPACREDLAPYIYFDLRCPEFDDDTRSGIGINRHLYGIDFGKIAVPTEILLTADCRSSNGDISQRKDIDDWRHPQRHGNHWRYPAMFVVSYADCHVKALPSGKGLQLQP